MNLPAAMILVLGMLHQSEDAGKTPLSTQPATAESGLDLLHRRADLSVVDVTLTRFREALQEAYGVPVRVATPLQTCQELVSIQGSGLRLADVIARAQRQLKTDIVVIDGAVHIGSFDNAKADLPTAGRATGAADSVAGRPSTEQRLTFRDASLSWTEVQTAAARLGFEFPLPRSLSAITIAQLDADGTPEAVVEALLLSEGSGWTFALEPEGSVTPLPDERKRGSAGR